MTRDTADESPDLTPTQVAARLNVHIETIRIWLREGTAFPNAYRLPTGRGWRIPPSDVEAIRRRGRGGGPAHASDDPPANGSQND